MLMLMLQVLVECSDDVSKAIAMITEWDSGILDDDTKSPVKKQAISRVSRLLEQQGDVEQAMGGAPLHQHVLSRPVYDTVLANLLKRKVGVCWAP